MKTIQIFGFNDNKPLIRAAGVKRVRPGWYTVTYRGPMCDRTTVCAASYNPKGDIKL